LKVLLETQDSPADFADRFTQEAKVSASLDHPNIVRVYDFGHTVDIFWYAMKYIDGPTLAQELKCRNAMNELDVAKIVLPILEALIYSHSRGVIHRDIKPSNIILSKEGTPYLADFGIAKSMGSLLKTRTGHFLGTPLYMAPEQASARPLDGRADMYALGVTMYELLTKKYPFPADDPVQAVILRLLHDAEPISTIRPDINPQLESIVMRALQKEPEDRYASAEQMRDALVLFLRDGKNSSKSTNYKVIESRSPQVLKPRYSSKDTEAEDTESELFGTTAPETLSSPRMSGFRKLWIGIAGCVLLGLVFIYMVPRYYSESNTAPEKEQNVNLPIETNPTLDVPEDNLNPSKNLDPNVQPEQSINESNDSSPVSEKPVKDSQNEYSQEDKSTVKTKNEELAENPRKPKDQPPAPLPRRPVQPPQLLSTVPPQFNDELHAACLGEIINLSLLIGEDGNVLKAKTLSSGHPQGCVDAVKTAVLEYIYQPALDIESKPIQTTIAVAIEI